MVVAGIHGNEPAGWHGAKRVVEALRDREDRLAGRVVFLVGNVRALTEGVRYVDRDLNRAWTPDRIDQLRSDPDAVHDHEDLEQRELLKGIEAALERASGDIYLLDVHTTSGPGGPFTAVADSLVTRGIAMEIPVPLVLGLEELVDGTLHDYMGGRGARTLAFEAGQHDEPLAVDRAEAGIWLMLSATGLIRDVDFPEVGEARKFLRRDTRALPPVVEMRHRYGITPEDGFRMNPGYANFQRIEVGEVVAHDARGAVFAPEKARILMPLYQDQGSDGFFVVREFSPFWLNLSRALRTLGLQRWVHYAPGIHRHPERPGAYVINRRVARWYALQLMHLLGFRKHKEVGDVLIVLERKHHD